MKRTFFLMMILALAFTLLAPVSVQAQTSAGQTWTSSIYYYNPDTVAGSVSVTYYPMSTSGAPGSTPSSTPVPVAGHGSGEIFIGDVGVTSGFKGSAVLSSDVPVLAVYEQTPGGSDPNYGRLLYTAFDAGQGSSKVYIPNFVNNVAGFSTQVGIQNVTAGVATPTLTFYNQAGSPELTFTVPVGIDVSESWIFTGDTVGLPAGFDGSLVIDAGSATIVAAAEELQSNGRKAYAFEGVASPSTTVYMPSMMCRFSPGGQSSIFYIQNAGSEDTTVHVDIYNDATKKLLVATDVAGTIADGAKMTLDLCKIKGTAGKGGTAIISSKNGQNLAVVGKTMASNGLMTAFTGVAGGSTRVILPYVVWSSNPVKGYRATISVMNVGGTKLTSGVVATFYRPDGTVSKAVDLASAAKPLEPNVKIKIDPSLAKALRADGAYRGGVEITSSAPVIVTVRLERKISGVKGYTLFGEDYLGVAP